MKGLKFLAFAAILALPACASVKDKVTNAYYNVKDYGSSALPEGSPLGNKAQKLVDEKACPEVQLVNDLSSYYDFGGASPSEGNLVSTATMTLGEVTCAFGPKSVAVDTKLLFNGRVGGKGGMGAKPSYSYPYFVAILTPGGKILAKEVFAAPLDFSTGNTQARIESFRQIIPSYDSDRAGAHKIAVGFQLGKEQLAFNRALIKKTAADEKIRQNKMLLEQKSVTQAPDGTLVQTTTTTTTATGAPMPVMGATPAPVSNDPLDVGPLLLAPPTDDKKVND